MTTTPNYGMFLPSDPDSMKDVDTNLNNNWTKIENIPRVTSVASLPITDFSYSLGARVYHTGLKSIFVLIAQNAAWGNFWKPIQAKYGPWIQPGNSIIANPGTYQFGFNPIRYRISNTAKFIMSGSVDTIASTGYTDMTTALAPVGLNPLPPAIAPSRRSVWAGSPYPQTAGAANPIVGQLSIDNNGNFANGVWNPSALAVRLYYDGWEWVMGYGLGYGPTN
jgi:hypothetical protein